MFYQRFFRGVVPKDCDQSGGLLLDEAQIKKLENS